MTLTATVITTIDELLAVPVRDRVLATWEPGTPNFQAPYLAIRTGEADGGASSGGYGLLNEKHWAQMIEWGATLVHLPSTPDGDLITDQGTLMSLPVGTVLTLTWTQPTPPHQPIAPYTVIRSGQAGGGAASGRCGILSERDWANLLRWDAKTVQVVALPA